MKAICCDVRIPRLINRHEFFESWIRQETADEVINYIKEYESNEAA